MIVGDRADPHVEAVRSRLGDHLDLAIIDAASLRHQLKRLDSNLTELATETTWPVVLTTARQDRRPRGWVRRLAPAGWDAGTKLGSRRAASAASVLAALAAVIRDPAIDWLTPIDSLFAAENKLLQYRTAADLGIRVPRWLVATSVDEVANALGETFVMKPLGPGQYSTSRGTQRVVYVEPTALERLSGVDLMESPFIAQRLVDAEKHLRIVTVKGRAWVCELDGAGRPIDWRRDAASHSSFRFSGTTHSSQQALELANAMDVGYSSQDWVVTPDGMEFLDLNPGGQWLFLPVEARDAVSAELACWLRGDLA